MPPEIMIGLCLVVVFEGLLLFAAPRAWQKMATEIAQLEPRKIRAIGGIAIILGLVMLQLFR